jgi:hypothetical protein
VTSRSTIWRSNQLNYSHREQAADYIRMGLSQQSDPEEPDGKVGGFFGDVSARPGREKTAPKRVLTVQWLPDRTATKLKPFDERVILKPRKNAGFEVGSIETTAGLIQAPS